MNSTTWSINLMIGGPSAGACSYIRPHEPSSPMINWEMHIGRIQRDKKNKKQSSDFNSHESDQCCIFVEVKTDIEWEYISTFTSLMMKLHPSIWTTHKSPTSNLQQILSSQLLNGYGFVPLTCTVLSNQWIRSPHLYSLVKPAVSTVPAAASAV